MTLPTLLAGVYRHYKGPLYLVMGYAHDANSEQRAAVVYIGLQLDDAHRGPRLAVRDATDFFMHVCGNKECIAFGTATYDTGQCQICHMPDKPRFEYIGPTWEGEGDT
jgi:hypothetical protein